MQVAVGMIGGEWKLEQRISELLSDQRERTLKLGTGINHLLQLILVVFSISLAACQVGAAEDVIPRDEAQATQVTQVEATAQVEPTAQVELAQRVQQAIQAEQAVRVQQAIQGNEQFEYSKQYWRNKPYGYNEQSRNDELSR